MCKWYETERENRVSSKIGAMHLRPLPFYRTNIQFNKQPYDSGELHSAPVYECNWTFFLLANTITNDFFSVFFFIILSWMGRSASAFLSYQLIYSYFIIGQQKSITLSDREFIRVNSLDVHQITFWQFIVLHRIRFVCSLFLIIAFKAIIFLHWFMYFFGLNV